MPLSAIIVIGWLYVTVLIAANEPTALAGILSFLFYGALPCGLILYFAGSRVRRERQKFREMMAKKNDQESLPNQHPSHDDGSNTETNQ